LRIIPSSIVIILLLNALISQGQIDDAFLVYTNKNNLIENLIFLSKEYKIVYPDQRIEGPFDIFLMNGQNFITDTINSILPETIIPFGSNVLMISALTKWYFVEAINEKFKIREELSLKEIGTSNLWKIIKLDNLIFGIDGHTNKKLLCYNLNTSETTEVIPKYKQVVVNKKYKQLTLNYSYFLDKGSLLVFVFPEQCLYKVDIKSLKVIKIQFPYSKEHVWYYFNDAFSSQEYLVKHKFEGGFELYLFKAGELLFIDNLPYFPRSIVNENLQYRTKISESEVGHYLVPINLIERKNIERNYKLLDPIKIN
jgi:hypothetical protein